MTQLLNGRYEIFDPTNAKSGAQGVVSFVKDKKDNNQMYYFKGVLFVYFYFSCFFFKKSNEKGKWR